MNRKLRRQITNLWNEITDDQISIPSFKPSKQKAWMRLEILLVDNGLLSPRRERPSEKAMRKAEPELPLNKE